MLNQDQASRIRVDLSYLSGLVIPKTVIGVDLDGTSGGAVAYTLTKEGELRPQRGRSNSYERVYTPEVWWSFYGEKLDLVGFLNLIGRVACEATEAQIVIEGDSRTKSLLRREMDERYRDYPSIRVTEFNRSSGRYYKIEEVISAVLADVRSGSIVARPEFEDRPERAELMTHLSGIEARDSRMTALQRAFIYGVGYWSCAQQRPKYRIGPGPTFR